jgi:hypothetical protein
VPKNLLRRSTLSALLAAAVAVAPHALHQAPAGADVTTRDQGRVLSDSLGITPVSVPFIVCGNSVNIATSTPGEAHCKADSEVEIAD